MIIHSEYTCTKCGETKAVSDFPKDRTQGKGFRSNCKDCERKRRHDNYHSDLKAGRLANRMSDKRYKEKDREMWLKRKRIAAATQRERHPERVTARKKTYHAISSGRLEPQPCEICNSTANINAHHDDYSKPLDVRWLCRRCHDSLHYDDDIKLLGSPGEMNSTGDGEARDEYLVYV